MRKSKKEVELTPAQIEYRNALVKQPLAKIKIKKDPQNLTKPVTMEDYIQNKLVYLNNCVFWINEYQEGKVDLDRFLGTIESIKGHVDEMRVKIRTKL